jgi:hypothetical protein
MPWKSHPRRHFSVAEAAPPAARTWDLKGLVAWQVAMDFAASVHETSRRFPNDERLGLRLQLRRAAVSVPSNIAEGHGRGTPMDFARFARIARGSLIGVHFPFSIFHSPFSIAITVVQQ